ncbi:hypothetical protein Dimus_037376 [Dionaea muscipula]
MVERRRPLRLHVGSGSGGGSGGGASVRGGDAGGGVSVRCGGADGDSVGVGVGSGGLLATAVPSSGLGVAPAVVTGSSTSGLPPGSAPEHGSCQVALQSADSEKGGDVLGFMDEVCMDLDKKRSRGEMESRSRSLVFQMRLGRAAR